MVTYVSRNVIGVYATDEKGHVQGKNTFPDDPHEVAERLHRINSGELIEEEEALIKSLKLKKGEVAVFDTPKKDHNTERMNPATIYLQRNEMALANDAGVADLIGRKNAVSLALLRFTMRAGVGRDRLLVNAIEALDVLDKSLNLLSERIREWYGIHFPELDQEITDHEQFISLVLLGTRENAAQSSGEEALMEYSKRSLGIELGEGDIQTLSGFAASLQSLFIQRNAIASYIEDLMDELAPNVKAVAGPNLGARVIALAGTIKRLARMPSSTVQILGAERALFKHLAKGTPSPKHGVIFQHPAIGHAPMKLRGRVARAVAAKISLAAKMDYYSHEDHGEELKAALEEKVERISGKGGEA